MRVLLTGASSFTGTWFARALAGEGATLTVTAQRPLAHYDGLPGLRLRLAAEYGQLIEAVPFGSGAFLAACERHGPFDLLCLHGATTAGHRRAGFDALEAAAADSRGIGPVLHRLAADGLAAVLFTDTLFGADNGSGTSREAFSPYGLAKTLSREIIRFEAAQAGLRFGRFVIPHPIGPLEKPGLTSGLAAAWLVGEEPLVERPALVRDLVPIDRLASAYARYAQALLRGAAPAQRAPSHWALPLGTFVSHFAAALEPRLGRACGFRAAAGSAPPPGEPMVRCNTETLAELVPEWNEDAFWDLAATWYRRASEQTAWTPELIRSIFG
jgi:nucleoside-diphosphate-sugar epimerase